MSNPAAAPERHGLPPTKALDRARAALTAHGFVVEILDDATAARRRIAELIPDGASVFTGASETLRLSGIDDDINGCGRYDSVKVRAMQMDRVTQRTEMWRAIAAPDFIVGSVGAVTESGSLVIGSATGSQLAGYAGAARCAIWVVGAQKLVVDIPAALRRLEEHCLPRENERALRAYGRPSALNRLLILNAEPEPGRGIVLLVRETIGF